MTLFSLVATVLAFGPACSSESGGITLPAFHDVSTAPPVIQRAARGVVRVRTARQVATASFISPSGLLLTNNHVLGDNVCPREGCFVEITRMHQRGSARQEPATVFAMPIAVDVGLDMAVVQLYTQRQGDLLDSPDYLTLGDIDSKSLIGVHVTVVGHPEGSLKKWTDGVVDDAIGDWFTTDAYTLPGDSGSPALDDGGHIVGLMHRGAAGEDLFSRNGVNVSSIGSASAPVVAAMGGPLPVVVVSIAEPTTAAAVVAHDLLYANAQSPSASVDGVTVSVLSLLASACDTALARTDFASPDDLSSALVPCDHATTWIDCRSGSAAAPYSVVCPQGADAVAWQARFQAMNRQWLAMNGQLDLSPVSFGFAHLQTTVTAGTAAGAVALQDALTAAPAALDFILAAYLAAFRIATYGGVDIKSYVVGYPAIHGYELQGSSIVSAAGWLNNGGALSRKDLLALLHTLSNDPMISMGTRLYIEDYLYDGDAL